MNEFERYKARIHLLDFMKHTWRNKAEPLVVGLHTKAICDLIDKAVNDFDDGKSTCLIINVPPRHGKSDAISKYEPVHFMATHPDKDVMVVSYNSSLAIGHSKFSRDLMETEDFSDIFPRVKLSSKKSASDSWGIENGIGTVTASGLSSGITGKGYHFGILDDYCSSRAEAESLVQRESMWSSFVNDFLTRQAPVSITIILATPWHIDDICGRIKSRNNPTSPEYDENFPKYKVVKFPAKNGTAYVNNNKGELERVDYDYLFTEHKLSTGEIIKGRFTKQYYDSLFASLGSYYAQALLQCEPSLKGGNLINTESIKYHSSANEFPITKYFRVWDLAHTAKQTQKDDPDWTSGTLLAYRKINDTFELWIKDVARIRANAPERDNFIRSVAEKDGAGVTVAVENSIESKDTLNQMSYILRGRISVKPINCVGDKVSRISYVEPIFEAGNVHLLRANWNLDWLNEIKEFPNGKHDDQVDNISAGYILCCNGTNKISTGKVIGV